MSELFIFLVVVAVVAIAVTTFLGRLASRRSNEEWPYYLKRPLTQPEQILYHRLVKALPECIVLAQVQVSRVLGVRRGANFRTWNNRIDRLSLDFVVCLKDATVVAAIELDDSSHQDPLRNAVDARKDKALGDAGVPILRWSVSALPDETAIRAAIAGPSKGEPGQRLEPFVGSGLARERRGFVDPLYMIFFATVGLGLALVSPIVGTFLNHEPILLWHWICLGGGVAVLAGCVWFVVREHKH